GGNAAVRRLADGACEEVGPGGWYDHATTHLADETCRLARLVGRDDHRPAGGEDPVQPARDDVPGQALREPDDVEVRARERERQALALLVREEADRLLDL